GVILGIVDIGFDYTHPTFYTDPSDKSTYRVKKVWDQRATTGTNPSGFSYGAEYSGTNAILAAAHDQDNSGTHATHVAGTAGGSGAGTDYKGMAPGADMVFVSTNLYATGLIDGISYIEKYAAAQGKPCVVNMSLGSDIGPHDGTTTLNAACNLLARQGLVMVASAGNSGDTKLHYGTGVAIGKSANTYLDIDGQEDVYIDCWSNNKKHFVVFVVVRDNDQNMAYVSYQTNGKGGKQQIKYNGTLLATVNADCETNSRNKQPHILMSLDASPAIEKGYDMMLQFQAVSDSVGFHAWISSGEFTQGDTEYTHSTSVAASSGVLSVAAYNTRTTWENSEGEGYQYTSVGKVGDIASFSGRGPLVNGLNKPDIAAPGAGIISAGNSYNVSHVSASRLIAKTEEGGKEYPWVLQQGTSMSSPAVAGIAALFLQKEPRMDIVR
ncbi:MAG: S8 family serine peptidase, partial [Bacteroidales bacterium]|nr:S8 family serine peptidase [Bacteroidales bacterium]